MQYTENYSMNKPQFGENALVTKLNENADTLDTLIYNTRQMQADTYDSTQTYNTGDLVSYNSALYICLADNVTGAWDSTKWSATTLAEQVELAKQSGGESALADLEDVNITNPSEGQILTYDDANDEWVNTDMPDTAVTKEASGNPIELTDAASAPLVKCVTAITGSQDLHGYDKPWVGGAGKNKLEITTTTQTVNGITFTINKDSANNVISVTVSGTASVTIYFQLSSTVKNLPANSYRLNGCPNISSLSNQIFLVVTGTGVSTAIDSGNGSSFTLTGTVSDLMCYIQISNGAIITTPITFYPMIRLSTETDSTFAPYSNICPITAYTEGEIVERGRNIADPSVYKQDYVLTSDGSENSATDYCITNRVHVDANTVYTCSLTLKPGGTDTLRLGFYDENMNFISRPTVRNESFTTPVNAYWLRLSYNNVNPDLTNIMIVKGSVPYAYEPYVSTTHVSTYPNAIYRGSEDCVNGEVTSEWGYYDFTSTTDWEAVTVDGIRGVRTRFVPIQANDVKIICSHLKQVSKWVSPTLGSIRNYIGNYRNLEVYIDGVDTSEKMIQWLSDQNANGTPLQIAYKLATQTTSSVTPTNLPIKSLSGYNHIESSTGEMEVEYITSEYQPLVDLIQSSNGHTYSTQEQVVGKWIDGSTLYEKTIYCNGLSGTSDWTELDSSVAYGKLISADGVRVKTNECFSFSNSLGSDPRFQTKTDNKLYYYTSSTVDGDMYITFRYTKPTTTRSLNTSLTSQKAQIEPLIAEEEEVPTEEEKAVNEEENNDETR